MSQPELRSEPVQSSAAERNLSLLLNQAYRRLSQHRSMRRSVYLALGATAALLPFCAAGQFAPVLTTVLGAAAFSGLLAWMAFRTELLKSAAAEDAAAALDSLYGLNERALTYLELSTGRTRGASDGAQQLIAEQIAALVPPGASPERDLALGLSRRDKLAGWMAAAIMIVNLLLFLFLPSAPRYSSGTAAALAALVEQQPALPEELKQELITLADTLENRPLDQQAIEQALKSAERELAEAKEQLAGNEELGESIEGEEQANTEQPEPQPPEATPTPPPQAAQSEAKEPEKKEPDAGEPGQEAGAPPNEGKKDNPQDPGQKGDQPDQSEAQQQQNGSGADQQPQSAGEGEQQQQGAAQSEQQGSGSEQEQGSDKQKGGKGQEQSGEQGQQQQSSGGEQGKEQGGEEGQQGEQGAQGSAGSQSGAQGNSSGQQGDQGEQGGDQQQSSAQGKESGSASAGLQQVENALDKIRKDQEQKGGDQQKQGAAPGGSAGNKDKKSGAQDAQQQDGKGASGEQGNKSDRTDASRQGTGRKGDDNKVPDPEKPQQEGDPSAGSLPSKEAPSREFREGEEGSPGWMQGEKAFREAEIKDGAEKFDPKFSSGKGEITRNPREARPRTGLEAIKLAKPESSKGSRQQRIPPEYEGIIR